MGYAPLDMREYTPQWTIEVAKLTDGRYVATVPAQPKLPPVVAEDARSATLAQQDAIMTFVNSDAMEKRSQV